MLYKTENPGFKIIEHPADTGIEIYAANVEDLFEIAAEGMFSIICETEGVGNEVRKTIKLREAKELKFDDLLILWLEKLLYVHETCLMLFSKFEVKKLMIGQGMSRLDAIIYGEKINLKKHEVFISIKAPTYHKLKVSCDSTGEHWSGRVIFDV
jgi:SHS2 domain-containing protein